MSEPRVSICEPWCTIADLPSPCGGDDGYNLSASFYEDWITVASEALYRYAGRQWPGRCSDTIRPCSPAEAHDYQVVDALGHWRTSSICGCGAAQSCGCGHWQAIRLTAGPVADVQLVKVDGVTLRGPSEANPQYRIDNHGYLVRLPDTDGTNPGWPCCQNLELADTEDETFVVTYRYGSRPPEMGVRAAAALACQLAQAAEPEKFHNAEGCAVPQRVTTIVRQGLTMQIAEPLTDWLAGKTGIMQIDVFLQAVNPQQIIRPARIVSPDTGGPYGDRVNT